MLVLPLVPVTAANRARLRAGIGGGQARECEARLRVGDQRARRHAGGPGGAFRRQHGGRTALHRVGNEAAAIGGGARQGHEQIAGGDRAAVGGEAGDRQLREARVEPGDMGSREHLSERRQE